MKRLTTYLFAAALSGLAATPAFADDAPRFTDEGFLDEWNAFLEEEKNSAKQDQVSVDLDFNLTEEEGEQDFVFFKTKDDEDEPKQGVQVTTSDPDVTAFTPRATSLSEGLGNIVLPGDSWLLNSFTPRYADAHLNLGLGTRSAEFGSETLPLFDISVASSVGSQEVDTFGAYNNILLTEALRRQVYNFGVNVGYSGFNLGATIHGEEGAYFDGISGYDVGVSYNQPTWSTSVLLGQYRIGNNALLGLNDPLLNTRFFAVEFGASYNISPWFKIVGTYRLYEDANLAVFDPNSVATNQMFFLGTNVSF